jgi:hypothetical protein
MIKRVKTSLLTESEQAEWAIAKEIDMFLEK